MKLTPLDIHHKEFRHSLRGYNEEEVDAFLVEVADELERLFKENIDLSEQLELAREQVRVFESQKDTLHNTLVAAQRSAEDIVSKARDEASIMLRDAEVKAKEIIHSALTQKQRIASELVRIKQVEEEFRSSFKRLLDDHLKNIREIPLPEDAALLVGRNDERLGGESEAGAQVEATRIASAKSETPAEGSKPVEGPKPAPPPEAKSTAQSASAVAGLTAASLSSQPSSAPVDSIEPPEPGFVQAVTLGEVDAPDLLAEEPDYGDPKEFRLDSLDSFGERDDDLDIEEID